MVSNNNVEINEGRFIYTAGTDPVVVMDGMTFLRSGVTVDPALYPLAGASGGEVGTTTYTPNLYFRVA
jgi:hypothetical protein